MIAVDVLMRHLERAPESAGFHPDMVVTGCTCTEPESAHLVHVGSVDSLEVYRCTGCGSVDVVES